MKKDTFLAELDKLTMTDGLELLKKSEQFHDAWEVLKNLSYESFTIEDSFVIAGRTRLFLSCKEGWCNNCIYDLYNNKGELVIGGFSKLEYRENFELFVIQFGDSIKYNKYAEEPKDYYYDYYNELGDNYWLILDKDFKSIMKLKNGKAKKFEKGFIIEQRKTGYTGGWKWNIPCELCLNQMPQIGYNIMIITSEKGEKAINLDSKMVSQEHEKIIAVDKDICFYRDNYGKPNEKIGICKLKKAYSTLYIEDEGFILFTEPVEGYVFAVKKDLLFNKVCENCDDEMCGVFLLDLNKPNTEPICAISLNEIEIIMEAISEGDLRISIDNWEKGLSRIMVPSHRLFLEEFLDKINPSIGYVDNYLPYWFSDSKHRFSIRKDECEDDNKNYDYDPRDDWWAMTDGHYGDEPDDFDGDYSFLGH